MTADDKPPESPPEQPPAFIKFTFPGGPHTTGLELQTSYVDAAQIELAGHFLIRHAEQVYAAAAQIESRGKLVIPPLGTKVGN